MSFSVVIPVYEQRPRVTRSLASVAGQTVPPREVIVIDDASTDGGGLLAQGMFPQFIHLRHSRNQGVGAARNTGLAVATGDWVAFLDSDDYWHPGHLEELTRLATQHPEAGLLATQYQIGDDRSDPPEPPEVGGSIRRIDYFREAARRFRLVQTSAVAMRRDVLVELDGFSDLRQGEDIELWARVALAHTVAVSDATTTVYMRGTGGVTEQSPADSQTPRDVRDLSPACRVAADALDRSEVLAVPRSSLRDYVDARVVRSMRAALGRGDLATARRNLRLLRGSPRALASPTVLLARMPRPVTTAVLRARGR